jgi:acylphosphatase
VRNSADGTVEAMFVGEDDAVAKLVEVCRAGPPGALVERVEVTDAEPEAFGGFEVR